MRCKISLIGYSGFIGNNLNKFLSTRYKINKINLRNENIKNISQKCIENIFQSDVVINAAASLNPRNSIDKYLNENFAIDLANFNKNFKKKIIHLSTINTLIKERKDIYTQTKKKCENKLKKKYNNLFIIRLPLVIIKKNGKYCNKGNLRFVFNYLNKIRLPFYPMCYTGHIYKPIEMNEIAYLIKNIIENKIKKKIINLSGSSAKSLWEICNEIADQENKKLLKINTENLFKIFPKMIKGFILKQNNFIQQIASINHTKYK